METLKEIDEYASRNELSDEERRALIERRMQILIRIREWREENKKLGLEPTISDDWTPQQRESFLRDWFDEINMEASCSDEMINPSEPVNEGASTSQMGRGEKRIHDDDDGDDDDEDERPYAIEGVKEVNIKKFRTKGTNYSLRFNNTMANVEIKDVHECLHEVFQHILDDTVGEVPSRDQVRMVIHSTQLKKPISFPFKPAQALTTERILSEVQRVVQSNQHFRLNDTVDVNVIHVSMPSGGKRGKRTEVNLEKHLEKRSLLYAFRTPMIYAWLVRLWWLKPKLITIVVTVIYGCPIGHCKRNWHRNCTPTPAFLWDRVVSRKLSGFKRI